MKKKLSCLFLILIMAMTMISFAGCSDESAGDGSDQATEETLKAADPMTDEEIDADDSDGCIENSDDLLE